MLILALYDRFQQPSIVQFEGLFGAVVLHKLHDFSLTCQGVNEPGEHRLAPMPAQIKILKCEIEGSAVDLICL